MTVLRARPLADPNLLQAQHGASLWWLGQAGFLIAMAGLRIVIDPYLSDALAEKYRGKKFPHHRMMPPPVRPEGLEGIDWLLCTHGHTDHMDPGTIPGLLAANPFCRVLVPRAEIARALERGVSADRLVTIDVGETIDLGGVICSATPSAHEGLDRDEKGYRYLGYVLTGAGVTIWHSGDTVPWPGQVEWLLPYRVDLALLPVNGRDSVRAANGIPGNLTLEEALCLADAIGARAMLGHHFGLFEFNTIDPTDGQRRIAGAVHEVEAALAQLGLAYDLIAIDRPMLSILLVCKGNICRSPTAHGALEARLADCHVDSAAIMDWNIGMPPHPMTQKVAADHGLDISSLRARQVDLEDFDRFDFILAMDEDNLTALSGLRPSRTRARLGLLGAYIDIGAAPPIEDPWGRDHEAFQKVFQQIDAACDQLARLATAHGNDRQRESGNGL